MIIFLKFFLTFFYRSQLAKLDSALELNARIRPFGFDNGPDRPHSRCLNRSLSTSAMETSAPLAPSKPKSDTKNPQNARYFYKKPVDDEYFRNLNQSIRAEEFLKMSASPLTQSRSKTKIIDTSFSGCKKFKNKRKSKKRLKKKETNSEEKLLRSNNSETYNKTHEKQQRNPDVSSNIINMAPKPLYPVNRPNLAATLRFEHSRNKLKQLSEGSESSLFCPLKLYHWGVKRAPGWQSLSYE